MATPDWRHIFNQWRAAYNTMSYAEHAQFYNDIGPIFPNQNHFNLGAARRFFNDILQVTPPSEKYMVLEIGGWRGDLAQYICHEYSPIIQQWMNSEVCDWARQHSVCTAPIYHAPPQTNWIWHEEKIQIYSVLVLSHVIEHMRAVHAQALLQACSSVSWLYIDTPLPDSNTHEEYWHDYMGTHILEWGWKELIATIKEFGFQPRWRQDTVHTFSRFVG